MHVMIRSLAVCTLLAAAAPAVAQDPSPMSAIKGDRWAEAQAIASRFADPVAEKLVLYMRLRAPGAATSAEIAGFMQRNPDWPQQAMLERRRQEAIASDPDDAAVLTQCAAPPPTLAAAMLRCAEAIANAGHTAEADALARKAWVEAVDDPGIEAAFPRRWGGIVTADGQWARFQRLAWTNEQAALRQITRLDPVHHKAAEARLAAKRDDPQTEALVAALPPEFRTDPGLTLDRVRMMRQAGALTDAANLLGGTVARGHEAAFWTERNLLARKLIQNGDVKTAYGVVVNHGQVSDEPKADADFLAGFIALRLLHDPALAQPHFRALAGSRSAITQGRAHYWLARSLTGKDARAEYEKSAAWPTTFYGQLSALALGDQPADRLRALPDPSWTQDTAIAFTGHEVLRAAAWLIAWGDYQRARAFLMRVDELAPIPAERALTAAFALRAGLPDSAVFVARRMGRDGLAIPRLGWPTPFEPPAPPDPAFSLGIMRQESSFDIAAVSSSGARGLMQLMPPTAQSVARQLGIPVSLSNLTSDAAHNMRLGTAYLQEVLLRFDNCLPLAAAAYNAGPHRVSQWLNDMGDPRVGPVDMVDWIELIPVSETRNYVQRVTENATIYRAQRNDPAPILASTPWTR